MRQAFVEEFSAAADKHVAEYRLHDRQRRARPHPAGRGAGRRRHGFLAARRAARCAPCARAYPRHPALRHLACQSRQIPARGAGVDLADVRFVDMPWLLQPDHPAVMVYPRPDCARADDLERFYALGIDAFRVAQECCSRASATSTSTASPGASRCGADGQFRRGLLAALIDGGKLTVLGETPVNTRGVDAEALAAAFLERADSRSSRATTAAGWARSISSRATARTTVFVEVRSARLDRFRRRRRKHHARRSAAKLLRAARHYLSRLRDDAAVPLRCAAHRGRAAAHRMDTGRVRRVAGLYNTGSWT